MVLHGHPGEVLKLQSFNSLIVQVDVSDLDFCLINFCLIDCKSVTMGGYRHYASLHIFNLVIGDTVSDKHLGNGTARGKGHQLVPQADDKYRVAALFGEFYSRQHEAGGCVGVSRAVAKKETV